MNLHQPAAETHQVPGVRGVSCEVTWRGDLKKMLEQGMNDIFQDTGGGDPGEHQGWGKILGTEIRNHLGGMLDGCW